MQARLETKEIGKTLQGKRAGLARQGSEAEVRVGSCSGKRGTKRALALALRPASLMV